MCNDLTVQKKELGLIKKCCLQNVFPNHIYLIYMYKENFALDKQGLICDKTKLNQTNL